MEWVAIDECAWERVIQRYCPHVTRARVSHKNEGRLTKDEWLR